MYALRKVGIDCTLRVRKKMSFHPKWRASASSARDPYRVVHDALAERRRARGFPESEPERYSPSVVQC